MKKVYIYGLFDPQAPKEFRVIGKTNNAINWRLNMYVGTVRRKIQHRKHLCPSEAWIQALLEKGTRPHIRIVETCNQTVWRQRERRAISLYRNLGHRLLNVNKGGNGTHDCTVVTHCSVCNTRKRTPPCGKNYCPKCCQRRRQHYSRSEKGRTCIARNRKTESRQSYVRRHALARYHRLKHTLTSEQREQRQRYCHEYYSGKKLSVTYRSRSKQYLHDYYYSKKLGLTVKEYRLQRQIAA